MHSGPPDPMSFIGQPVSNLPTPSLILSRPVMEENAQRVLQDTKHKGIAFRPHVKTLKCAEATRLSTGDGFHKKVVASTLEEIRGLVQLAKEGIIDEVAYGMPLPPSALPELSRLSQYVKIILFIDSISHIDLLEKFNVSQRGTGEKWPVFIKLDAGYGRAGIPITSPRLSEVIRRAVESRAVELTGLYSHSGQSYNSRPDSTEGDTAAGVMEEEVNLLLHAADQLPEGKFVLSFGATPQAHVVSALKASGRVRAGWTLELHAGNFLAKDLQQVSTGCCSLSSQALKLLVEVCSIYPERNEVLINAGRLALTSETSSRFPGFGTVANSVARAALGGQVGAVGDAHEEKTKWYVGRISQEHGILSTNGTGKAEETWEIGEKVLLYASHACITAAAHPWYFVVDEMDIVTDVWRPWHGW